MSGMAIATGAPSWVYLLLIALIVLGVRRLKTRDVPLVVALIPSGAFLIWSLVGASAFAGRAGFLFAATSWATGAVGGGVSAIVVPEARGERLPNGRIRQPGSWLPLIMYLGVFVIRFACGAWAAVVPEQAGTATAIGIAVGAAVTMRLIVGIARWRTAPLPTAA